MLHEVLTLALWFYGWQKLPTSEPFFMYLVKYPKALCSDDAVVLTTNHVLRLSNSMPILHFPLY